MSSRDPRDAALRIGLWLLLGGWVGSFFLFGAVVAPTLFRELPAEVAGRLVGPVLGALHLYGAVAGLALAGIGWALGRRRAAFALPLLLAGACLFSELWLTPRIDAARAGLRSGTAELAAAERFGSLHRRSVQLFVVVGVGTLVLLGLHAHADAAPRSGPGSGHA